MLHNYEITLRHKKIVKHVKTDIYISCLVLCWKSFVQNYLWICSIIKLYLRE